ncbi:hypothetical protein GBA65_12260 [Rubrobacter marinus]|uniref:Uncharacterized protein n=1 Tax=Rubrobacter marinus TaxID=2653852 RepID=A0A6G8PY88_9ACTN|nr:hypothetical protein [Rubrobacter marinus]QIN79166.1 hypothetical protein GBA65_12260 [Rubrobacter marinus]
MSSAALFRLSGLALLIALPLQVLGFVLHPPSEQAVDVLKPLYATAHLVVFASWLFALLGLTGLYARQAHRAGVLGLLGFAATMFAAAYHFYLLLYEAYAVPLLAQDPATRALIGDGPMAHGAGALGPLALLSVLAFPLFGIATVRARVLPRMAGWLQIASVPVFFASIVLVPLGIFAEGGTLSPIAMLYYLTFLGYAWGGYALWTGKERVREPAIRRDAAQPVA